MLVCQTQVRVGVGTYILLCILFPGWSLGDSKTVIHTTFSAVGCVNMPPSAVGYVIVSDVGYG